MLCASESVCATSALASHIFMALLMLSTKETAWYAAVEWTGVDWPLAQLCSRRTGQTCSWLVWPPSHDACSKYSLPFWKLQTPGEAVTEALARKYLLLLGVRCAVVDCQACFLLIL